MPLAPIEVEALLHAEPVAVEDDAETIEMVPLVAPAAEAPRLARGSDALRPRRRRIALSIEEITTPLPPPTGRLPRRSR